MKPSLARTKQGALSLLTGGAGAALMLLHGIPGSADAWARVGEQLAEHYQLFIPDLVGFGESDAPRDDYYLEAQAEVLRRLLADLGIEELFLAGHDFGGPVALTLLRRYPELHIKGLILSATNLFTDTPIPPPLRLAGVPLVGTLFFWAATGTRPGLWALYMAAAKHKARIPWRSFQRHLTPAGIDLTRRIFQRSLADLPANYRAIEAMLATLTLPTLLLWGDSDPFFARDVAIRTQRALGNATLTVYAGTGHFVPEEQPEQVARAIHTFCQHTVQRGVADT